MPKASAIFMLRKANKTTKSKRFFTNYLDFVVLSAFLGIKIADAFGIGSKF